MTSVKIIDEIFEMIRDYEPLENEGVIESCLIASMTWHGDTSKIEVENGIRALLRTGKIYECKPIHYKVIENRVGGVQDASLAVKD